MDFNNVVVAIPQGKLKGKVFKDCQNEDYLAFMSVPYAKPPLGPLRFEAPVEAEPWEGILDATKDLPFCFQNDPIKKKVHGTEDCLYVNIYTKSIFWNQLTPVLVFIHGGGFGEGSGRMKNYGPDYLIPEGIVVVSINYRLSLLGAISTEDQSILAGNYGLKDQTMALKWVQKNIKYFGGNPDNVTLMGQSSGGASVHLHMLSPISKGLFHRVIIHSASSINFWIKGAPDSAKTLAKKLGISTDNVQQMVQELKNCPAEKITIHQQRGLISPPPNALQCSPLEEYHSNYPNFLPDDRLKIIQSGQYSKVPMLIGYNTNEGIFFDILKDIYESEIYAIDMDDFRNNVPRDLNCYNKPEIVAKVAEEMKKFYCDGKRLDDPDEVSAIRALIQSDIYFRYGIEKAICEHLKTSDAPIYFYEFGLNTKLNVVKRVHPHFKNIPGTSHTDELGYLFKTFGMKIKPNTIEEKCMKTAVKLWTNFIKEGNPTPKSDPTFQVKWEKVEKDKMNCYKITNDGLSMTKDPHKKNRKFWDYIYDTYTIKSSHL